MLYSRPKSPFLPYVRENISLTLPFYREKPVRALQIVWWILHNQKYTKKEILIGLGFSSRQATKPTQWAGAFRVLNFNNILVYNTHSRKYEFGGQITRYIIYVLQFMQLNGIKNDKVFKEFMPRMSKSVVGLYNDLNI